jgi:hypothetical protein
MYLYFQSSSRSLAAQVMVQLADVEGDKFAGRLDTVLAHFSSGLDAKFDAEAIVPILQSLTKIVRQCQSGVTKRLSSVVFADIWGTLDFVFLLNLTTVFIRRERHAALFFDPLKIGEMAPKYSISFRFFQILSREGKENGAKHFFNP